jgi:hypothetical protein
MRGLIQNIWFRIVLVFIIAMGAYTVLIAIPQLRERARQQLPNHRLIELRTAVNQNYIAYQTLASYRGGPENTSLLLSSAEDNFRASITSLTAAQQRTSSTLDSGLRKQLAIIADRESKLLDLYSGRLNALRKPLDYIPEGDITLSNSPQNINRAKATAAALNTLASTTNIQLKNAQNNSNQQVTTPVTGIFQLADDTKQALSTSAECFIKLANQLQHDPKHAPVTFTTCKREYFTTRTLITSTVTWPLRDQTGANIQAQLRDILKQLDKMTNY